MLRWFCVLAMLVVVIWGSDDEVTVADFEVGDDGFLMLVGVQ